MIFKSILTTVVFFATTLIAEEPFRRIGRYKTQLCNEFKSVGMRPFGSGGSSINGENHETAIAFSCPIKGDIPTARYWIVSMIERYLTLVNADLLVRPYMHEYPYGPENCGFSIDFIPNPICSVMQAKGKLLYFKKMEGVQKPFYTETYSEALEAYKQQLTHCTKNEIPSS